MMRSVAILSTGLELNNMNPQQLAAVNKLLNEVAAVRNALESWRDHMIDPREALGGLTTSGGQVVIGDNDTWNKALEYLETVENAQPVQPSPVVAPPEPAATVEPAPAPADATPDSGAQSPTSAQSTS